MAIVHCPECHKKLKVADTSIGKKVKCSCGQIFVAPTEDAATSAPPKPVVAVTPEKVFVACTECSAKLKVATTSLGKKMKCPKCAGVFIANIEVEAVPTPAKKTPKPSKTDDLDDLLSFAQAETEARPKDDEDDMLGNGADRPKAKAKAGKKADRDDMFEDEDQPQAKAAVKKAAKPTQPFDEDDGDQDEEDLPPTKAEYPRRTLLNVFVFVLLFLYLAFFAAVFLDFIEGKDLGMPKKSRPQPKLIKLPEKEEPDKANDKGRDQGGVLKKMD